MDISGVLQTIFNVDYVLTPIAADNFVMDSSFVFAKSVMKFLENRKNIPLKDVFLFWTKVKKRSNTEVLVMTRNSHPGPAPISAVHSFHRRQDNLKAADCRNWQMN